MRRRLRAALSLLLAAAVLAGCGGEARPAPSATVLPDGVSVRLVQLRSDVADRQAQVQVRNDSDDELFVGDVRVVDPRFARPASRPRERDTAVQPGGTVDIRVQLPPMDCATPDAGESSAIVPFALGEAISVAVVPLPEAVPFLADLHERECRAEALADAVVLGFSDFTPSSPGAPADLVLDIQPTGDAAARIEGIRTTNLLTFGVGAAAETFPLGVDVGTDSAPTTVRLPLVPLRCDAHAVQEDKRGTIFTLDVVVDGEPGEIELAASAELRGRILTWVAQWCGFGG
ncbi:hypothetical protein [Microbacterium sp. RU33B]|uniref:hypothetical protein n=1 Tax=Microbacterium sp. RU33B TaxID=1907390 RepID=UPI0009617991|nr:hypothetical protein [Microbacterium sp. RU33B]SIT86482.1 hypothetical protein SAMN05880545_2544 [Microbacterium sp. RU33B]